MKKGLRRIIIILIVIAAAAGLGSLAYTRFGQQSKGKNTEEKMDLAVPVAITRVKAGNITGISVNAKTIAALASLLPLVFKETYTEVYPISGSKYYYKGGSLSGFVQAAQNLFDQAETLAKLSESNDTSGVEAQMSKLFDNCKACHSTYSGTN